jgi:crotonobetainyl-CoA:carnitine CoA-transferase CaiB-like acyl-CoA transferase
MCSCRLADAGARVIKIERPEGDFAPGYDALAQGQSTYFVWLNRGKESIVLDLVKPEDKALLEAMLAKADVFIQNLKPGAVAKLGFAVERLRRDYPRLIVCSVSGYGDTGPYATRKAYDMLIQAEAGLISITGTPDTPVKTGIPTSDIAAGMYASQAVLAALLRRCRTGEGATIDVAMLDATVEWMGHALYTQMHTGAQPPRMGLSHSSIAPYDAYPTQDGEVLIGVQNDRGWRALVTEVFGAPELADDPRFGTNVARVRNRHECDGVVASHTKRWTAVELDARLAAAGVPAAQVKYLDQVLDHPQLRQRGRWRTVETEHGPTEALLPPAIFTDVEARMGNVPALGQHTHSLLAEAGLDSAAIDDALSAGVARQADRFQPVPRS